MRWYYLLCEVQIPGPWCVFKDPVVVSAWCREAAIEKIKIVVDRWDPLIQRPYGSCQSEEGYLTQEEARQAAYMAYLAAPRRYQAAA